MQKLHVDSHWTVFLKTRPFVKRNNTVFTNVSSFTSLLMCSTHFTLSCRILPFSLPTTYSFFKFVYSEITRESAVRVLFRSPLVFASLAIEGHKNWTYDSGLLISRTFLPSAGSSCTLLFCLYLVSCTQKMHWRKHSLADTIPLFSTILQLSSELSKNWGTGLPCLCPSWIYCAGQQHKASLLPFCFPVFPPFVYSCCIMDCTYHSHKSCPSTLAPLCHHSSIMLTSPSRSRGMPMLALVVPQTLTFLSSNVWADLTLLWKLSW